MRAERNVPLYFVSEDDLVDIGRTWATAARAIAGALLAFLICVFLMLVMKPRTGMGWALAFYGGQSLLAALNLLRAAYVARQQVLIERKRKRRVN
jgi:hypothetical protein